METIPHHELLIVTQEEFQKVRKSFNMDNLEQLRETLDAIREWCEKQEHLASALPYLNHRLLERFLLISRGSMEKTKIKIDKILTMKGMFHDLSLNKSIEEFENFNDSVIFVPLPRLCPDDFSRIYVTQMIPGKMDGFNLLAYIRYCFLIGEYRLYHDYSCADRFILDLKNVNFNILTKLNPVILKKGELLCTEGFGTKIKGIHIVNAPSFVDKFVFIIKQGLREKVASRLHVHSSYEDLYKEIPKYCLPKDYGGEAPSCEKLADLWKERLNSKEARVIVDECNKLVADESKRSQIKFNEEYLGMPGSFRKLVVD